MISKSEIQIIKVRKSRRFSRSMAVVHFKYSGERFKEEFFLSDICCDVHDVTESSEEQIRARLLHICRERVSSILEKRREREAGLKHKDTFIVLDEEVQIEVTDMVGRTIWWRYKWFGKWYKMGVSFGVLGVCGLPPFITEEGLADKTKESMRSWTTSEIRRFRALEVLESIT